MQHEKITSLAVIILFIILLSSCGLELNRPSEDQDLSFLPTHPIINPTDPTVVPTEPTIVPTDPTLIPSDPTVVPTEPTVVPTDPTVIPPSNNIESFERLFNDEVAKSLTIEITSEEWNALDQKMIAYHNRFGNWRLDDYARAKLIYEDDQGTLEIENVGFRTRGNTSRVRIQDNQGNLNMSHFKISFKEDFDEETLVDNKKRTVFNLEEIDMKYNRNWDSTYITEKYSYDLFRSFGVYAPYVTLAKLYVKIDDVSHFYGIYSLIEPIDDLFLERRMTKNEAEGNLYKSLWQHYGPASLQTNYHQDAIGIKDVSTNYRPAYDLKTNKKTNDHSELISFINQINMLEGSPFQSYIHNHFDIDRLLRLLAVGVLLGNPDDYRSMGNNYYLYYNPVKEWWTMIPYDYDHGLGQGWNGEPVFSNYTIGADIYEWGNLNAHMLGIENYPHPLTDKILNIRTYQMIYELYLDILTNPENGFFSFEAFYQVYNQQKQLYQHDVAFAMLNQGFNRRNTEWYFNEKVADVRSQLIHYAQHPYTT